MSESSGFLADPRPARVGLSLPKVIIIVTSYNYASFIIDCLRSVARQSYQNFFCVVVDDCSTDGSAGVVAAFAASEEAAGRFSLVSHKTNRGQGAAFATGLSSAAADFVVYVDADDILLEDFVAVHIRAHLEGSPVAFTSSNQYQINSEGRIVAGSHTDLKCGDSLCRIPSISLHRPFWLWATTSSIMFRKSVLDLVLLDGGDTFRICADNFICHFANLLGGSLLIPSVHGGYRRHANNGFSGNALIGGCHPTGDMSCHPRHEDVRRKIAGSLLAHPEVFSPQLSKEVYWKLLAFCAKPSEIRRCRPKGIPVTFIALMARCVSLLQFLVMLAGSFRKSSVTRDLNRIYR